jgi:hypothetical protein
MGLRTIMVSSHGRDAEKAIPTAVTAGYLDLLGAPFKQGCPYVLEHKLLLLAAKSVKYN